jgi:peptide/nickel transport system permease protein
MNRTGRQTARTVTGLGGYVLRRGLVILLTILIGVYATVLICNQTGALDASMWQQVEEQVYWAERHDPLFVEMSEADQEATRQTLRQDLARDVGLTLPTALRNLRWTFNALTFRWGQAVISVQESTPTYVYGLRDVNAVVLHHLPNTLLIIGTANLITFLLGIPLALNLAARRAGGRLDRLITMLAPISSVPSWVHGIILVAIFAVQLHWLPHGGRYDILPAETWVDQIRVLAKHMALPVLATLLGIFFQFVYAWRTFLVIFAQEDYVELARAKGLPPSTVERRYLLRPSLPFVITGFALTLVSFWQMTTALERFFHWPGIGQLYLQALPQYYEEYFYVGELSVVLSIVVAFAYLLGLTVFVLDFAYAWVDPRVRLERKADALRPAGKGIRWRDLDPRRWRARRADRQVRRAQAPRPVVPRDRQAIPRARWQTRWQRGLASLGRFFRELRRYPSAIAGLVLILLFAGGSLYAVLGMPYAEIGAKWHASGLTGKLTVPKNVPAVWVNWFRRRDLPSTILASSRDGSMGKATQIQQNGNPEIHFSLDLDYPYGGFPQDLLLYVSSTYAEKRPHLFLTWTTPDGRAFQPKSPTLTSETQYVFSEHLNVQRVVRQNEHWDRWFAFGGPAPTPTFYVLFADPEADRPVAQPGTYRLEVTALAFEPDTDVDLEFVLLGRVSGWAGTDYLRRDLLVPLLWGIPTALAFGLVGATLTTLLAMILGAAGAWFGGWVDGVIQRLTEINMILPILAIGVLIYALYDVSLLTVLVIVVALTAFGSPTKVFRSAFLQVKEAPYIESARAYGASNSRIILRYLLPRITPTAIPQLVALIPSMVFLEATLAILGVYDPRFPTWGQVIHDALRQNALWGGSDYWVLEPIALLLLMGLAFALFGFALERILNPRMQTS